MPKGMAIVFFWLFWSAIGEICPIITKKSMILAPNFMLILQDEIYHRGLLPCVMSKKIRPLA
jgi:hypothetical protein